jgi:hypothetical protein
MCHNDLDRMMAKLGYTQEWLDLGIVDADSVREQYAEFQHSDSKNHEHYRWVAYVGYLGRMTELADSEVERIFALKSKGQDGCDLSVSRIIELISSDILTDEQIEALTRFDVIHKDPIKKRYARACMFRRMCREGLTEEIFDYVKKSGDTSLHKWAMAQESLRREHVEWFVENGANKAIRNRCKERLCSRRFR